MSNDIDKRRELVLAAIEYIKVCDEHFRKVEANAQSTVKDRGEARILRDGSVAEFGGQWRNVEAILKGGE